MITHVVMMKFKPEVTAEQVDELAGLKHVEEVEALGIDVMPSPWQIWWPSSE